MINVFNMQQLLHQIIKKLNPIRKELINKPNWEGINSPSKLDDCNKFEKNNPTIAINNLYTKEK